MADPQSDGVTVPTLVMTGGPLDGTTYPLTVTAKELVLGSSMDADVQIMLGNVEPQHASLSLGSAGLAIADGGSATGTFVNGEKVEGVQTLQEGDRICLGPPGAKGSAKLLVRLPGGIATAAAEEPPAMAEDGPEAPRSGKRPRLSSSTTRKGRRSSSRAIHRRRPSPCSGVSRRHRLPPGGRRPSSRGRRSWPPRRWSWTTGRSGRRSKRARSRPRKTRCSTALFLFRRPWRRHRPPRRRADTSGPAGGRRSRPPDLSPAGRLSDRATVHPVCAHGRARRHLAGAGSATAPRPGTRHGTGPSQDTGPGPSDGPPLSGHSRSRSSRSLAGSLSSSRSGPPRGGSSSGPPRRSRARPLPPPLPPARAPPPPSLPAPRTSPLSSPTSRCPGRPS